MLASDITLTMTTSFESIDDNTTFNSSSPQSPILGTTSPISFTEPKLEDFALTEQLKDVLGSFDIFETQDELNHRSNILIKLNLLVKEWIQTISLAKHMPEQEAKMLGGKICTFGSYRLGVHNKGADIDALCIAPRNIEYRDFFTSFFELLQQQPGVTECRSVEDAFVPVIKMNIDGIEIDLLFARLALKEIPDDLDLRDDYLLRNLDAHSVRSLNGCRVCDEIMNLVPNVDNFLLTLRTIKLWAKKHGIYSNSLGYFGGITWAILVARTCQLYPNATASTLVHKFFLVFSKWQWPMPVFLKAPVDIQLGFPVWNPKLSFFDQYHLMPVITPAYPHQNSTFNVSESTKKRLMNEIESGLEVTKDIIMGNATWDSFFEAPSFFYQYRHFIVVKATTDNQYDHINWSGLVESKIRILISFLERIPHIVIADVKPKCYRGNKINSNVHQSEFTSMWFIGLKFAKTSQLNVDLTYPIRDFQDHVYFYADHIQMLEDNMVITAHPVKRQNLGKFLNPSVLKTERTLDMNKRRGSSLDLSGGQQKENQSKKLRLGDSDAIVSVN